MEKKMETRSLEPDFCKTSLDNANNLDCLTDLST